MMKTVDDPTCSTDRQFVLSVDDWDLTLEDGTQDPVIAEIKTFIEDGSSDG